MSATLNIAIIGAGIAGVSAAHVLKARGCAVSLFEKSRGHGGRCSTKRWEGHAVDHGAQFFTMRDERFMAAARGASGACLMKLTSPVIGETGNELPDSGRWYHREGNSRLARDLAQGLEIEFGKTVEHAESLLRRAGGRFDHVVSTAPFPQTARLFDLQTGYDYVPCLTALLAYRGEWLGISAGQYAISDHHSPLAWSACENHKSGRISAGHTVFVAQMSGAFSREHLERPPHEFVAIVRPLVEARWKLPAENFLSSLGHRWRYARVARPMAPVELPPGLHFTGDALTSSRVEDAWLAGADFGKSITLDT